MNEWHIYIQEAKTQLGFAKHCFAEFECARTMGDVESVFFNLHHFLVHIVNVDKLLDPKPGTKRALLLSGHVDLSGIDLKSFRKLRNHLEHFDGRLDTWIENYNGCAFLDMNIVTGTKGFPDKAFLRALDGDVFKFHGENYPLAPLCLSVEALLSQFKDVDKKID